MLKKVTKTFQYGHHKVTLEVGEIARQASAAVLVRMNDTVVLVSCVAKKEGRAGADFFPLTVNYQEKTYAAGKVPGGYFKREGRPTEMETLTSRLIDRPIRPLFPDGYKNEVQIVATVMSLDPTVSPDIPAIIGASAAAYLSGAPFAGPIGAARVGYYEGEFLLNPSEEELKLSELNLVVAGTEKAVLMVESEAKELPEQTMLDAVIFGHQHMQVAIDAIKELKEESGAVDWEWETVPEDEALKQAVAAQVDQGLREAYVIADKATRKEKVDALRDQLVESLADDEDESKANTKDVLNAFAKLEKTIVRNQVLDGNARIDGRDTRTVRPITIRTGILPRAHGSVLFTRGETQAIVSATLGSSRDSQIIDALNGEYRDSFMLHYNFPPYCVGEAGMMTGPKRREIGHGRLAKRAMLAVIPDESQCPYVLRVVSEITESNGSSSMASVCGASLSLMDAGVPIKAPVAGIAMGLIKEENRFAVLTDILGDEDHLGDMDFKVAGTTDGVTALQMDIKIDGINRQIMQSALEQAKEARMHILGKMQEALSSPRQEMSEFAPRILSIQIKPEKISEVIGKGGATIRALCEEMGVTIDIEDTGIVKVFASDGAAGKETQRRIEELTRDVQLGEIFEGKIEKIMDFGAFIKLVGNKTGFLHISQICEERVEDINTKLSVGEVVKVKVVEIDRQGRIRVSTKPSVFKDDAE